MILYSQFMSSLSVVEERESLWLAARHSSVAPSMERRRAGRCSTALTPLGRRAVGYLVGWAMVKDSLIWLQDFAF